jgi:hypothetical protein
MARPAPEMPYDKLLNALREMGEYEVAREVEEWENVNGNHGGVDGWFKGKYPELEDKVRRRLRENKDD